MKTMKGVADTLFIPLEARIFVSKRYPEYFYDEKALSLEKHVPDENIRKRSSEYSFMASAARYYNIDSMTKAFCLKHGTCNIVMLGAGLDTAYYRLNEPKAVFYEVDLPEVIETRRILLGEHDNEILIGGDLFDMKWTERIDSTLPTLLIASGVFQYFTEEKVVGFIRGIRSGFCVSELVFDATNEAGIRYANKYVRKTGNMDARMYFYVNDGAAFARTTGTTLLEERVFFTDARKMLAGRLGLYTRIAMKIVDDKKRAVLLHLGMTDTRIEKCLTGDGVL